MTANQVAHLLCAMSVESFVKFHNEHINQYYRNEYKNASIDANNQCNVGLKFVELGLGMEAIINLCQNTNYRTEDKYYIVTDMILSFSTVFDFVNTPIGNECVDIVLNDFEDYLPKITEYIW